MIPETLITYIETEIIPRYKDFDKAHNLSHVRTVIEESLALARQYPEADERLAYTMAEAITFPASLYSRALTSMIVHRSSTVLKDTHYKHRPAYSYWHLASHLHLRL